MLGFNWAMTKQKTNDTINELSIRAVECSHQMASSFKFFPDGSVLSQEMGERTRLNYPIAALAYQDYFILAVEHVPLKVCRMILDQDWQEPFEILVDDQTDDECSKMSFKFADDLRPCSDEDCPEDYCPIKDKNGKCFRCSSKDVITTSHQPDLCAICPNRFLGSNNNCYSCSTDQTVNVSDGGAGCSACGRIYDNNKCYNGCESIKNIIVSHEVNCPDRFIGNDGKSYPCSSNWNIGVSDENECKKCEGRVMVSTGGARGCAPECGSGYFMDKGGGCVACDWVGGTWSFWVHKTDSGNDYSCRAACPNRAHPASNYCMLCDKGYFYANGTTCFPCSITDEVNVVAINYLQGDSACETACSNRQLISRTEEENGKQVTKQYCVLK